MEGRGGVATNDLFTAETINLEYLLLSISLWTGQQKLLLKAYIRKILYVNKL